MYTRLILVEGLPGAGKSTTAQFIWLQMLKNNIAAEFISDGKVNHPVDIDYDDNNTDIEKYIRESTEKWKRLTNGLIKEDKIYVIESSLLQNPLNCMVTADVSIDVIKGFIDSLQEIIKEVNPVLIYLEQKDTKEAVRMACELKGEGWTRVVTRGIGSNDFCKARGLTGMDALERFLDYRNELEHQALSWLMFDKYIVDVTERHWEEDRRNITGYLKLEYKSIFPVEEDADDSLAGTYDNTEINRPFTLYIKDNKLMCFNEILIPKEKDIYYLQGLPVELKFHRNNQGNPVSIEVGGAHIGFFFPIGTVFKKC